MVPFTFSKDERLLNRRDFVNLNQGGKRYQTAHFSVILKHNGLGTTRLGVIASKKIGNAVQRNRVKRLIREFFRLHKTRFPPSCDLVIAAKKGAYGLNLWQIKEELGEIILDKEFNA
jgi:ribonuclease P protein component